MVTCSSYSKEVNAISNNHKSSQQKVRDVSKVLDLSCLLNCIVVEKYNTKNTERNTINTKLKTRTRKTHKLSATEVSPSGSAGCEQEVKCCHGVRYLALSYNLSPIVFTLYLLTCLKICTIKCMPVPIYSVPMDAHPTIAGLD